jgi:imidazolonepropionase-like amidohydrolase
VARQVGEGDRVADVLAEVLHEAIRAATTVSAELIDVDDRGRLAPGLLADVIAVPGDPLVDIGVTGNVRFVMKGGQVYRHDTEDA